MARKRQQREAAAKVPKVVPKPEDPVDIQYLIWLADAREASGSFALPHDRALRYMRNGWVQSAVNDKDGSQLYSLTDAGLRVLKEVLDVRKEPNSKV